MNTRSPTLGEYSYSLRRDWLDAEFIDAVQFIREHGVLKVVADRRRKCFCVGNFSFYTNGTAIEQTILLYRITDRQVSNGN